MSELVTQCPLCKGTYSTLFDRQSFKNFKITNRLCSQCGLVYQSPRLSDDELETFYTTSYREIYQGNEGPSAKDLVVQEKRAKNILAFTSTNIPTINRHLDIGCSAGTLLTRFRGHYNCQSVGIEPGKAYREYAQEKGLTVYQSLKVLEEADEHAFDLVSMIHVLEHLPSPAEYLRGLRERFLLPEGFLLIEVPNLYAHDSFELAHLSSFSAHTLTQIVISAGFKVNLLRKHGQPRSQLLPLYITLLAQPKPDYKPLTSNNIKKESLVGAKRKAGMLRRRLLQKLFPQQAWVQILPKSQKE